MICHHNLKFSAFPKSFCILGFEKPSAIQQRAIRPIVKGRDVIAQAQSGTGKTATFSISVLQVSHIFYYSATLIIFTLKILYQEWIHSCQLSGLK